MLVSLHVRNLALIEETEVFFQPGLNILTGETGAGKSVILGSVALALGAKADRDMIRTGAEYALIELTFEGSEEVREALRRMDLPAEDNQIILQRRVMPNRSICRINGETVPIRQMRELHHLQQFCHFRFDRRRIRAFTPWQHRQAKSDIVKHRHMAKQRVMLEHETDFTVPRVQTAHVGTVKANMPAGLMLQPGNNAQQRGFSGTGRPQQRDHLTRRNIQ